MTPITNRQSLVTRAFTLIELLIYMGLLAIFLLVLTQIFISSLDTQIESEAASAINSDGRFILSRLIYDLKRASAVITPSSLGAQANNLQISISGITVSYSENTGNLILSDNQGSDKLNSSESTISNLNFRRIGTNQFDTIQINFTLSSQTLKKGSSETKNFQTTVSLR